PCVYSYRYTYPSSLLPLECVNGAELCFLRRPVPQAQPLIAKGKGIAADGGGPDCGLRRRKHLSGPDTSGDQGRRCPTAPERRQHIESCHMAALSLAVDQKPAGQVAVDCAETG